MRTDDGNARGRWAWVAAVAAIAVGVRAAASAGVEVIRRDGIYFVAQADKVRGGDWAGALGWYQHPLFAVLTAWVADAFGLDTETAGRAVSVVCGGLAAVPVMLLARRLVGQPAALVAGLVYAVLPQAVRVHAQPLSEGVFHLAFLSAAAAGVAAFQGCRLPAATACGIAGGLAYLGRPEGLGVPLVVAAFLVVWRPRAWRAAAAVGLATAVVAGPYIAWLSADAGRLRLTAKKDVAILAGVDAERRVQRLSDENLVDRPAAAAGSVVRHLFEAMTWAPLALAILGAFVARRPRRRGEWLVLAIVALHVAVLFRLALTYSYLDKRHALTPGLLTLAWTGAAVAWLGVRFGGRFGARAGRRAALVVTTALLVGALAPVALRSNDERRLPLKRLGEWVAANTAATERIAPMGFPWVSYYAGRETLDILGTHQDVWFDDASRERFDALAAALRAARVTLVVESSRQREPLRRWLAAHADEVHTERGNGDRWWRIRRLHSAR